LAIANMAGTLTVQAKSDTAVKSPAIVQGAVRPASLLKQNSVIALLDAKDRLSTGSENTKLVAGKATDVAPHSEGASDATPVATATTVTVNSSATHWNFDDKTIAGAALQISRLQMDGRGAPQPSPLSSLHASTSTSVSAAAVAASPKEAVPTAKIVDSLSQTQPQAVSASAANAQGNPSFSPGDEAGPNLQGQATGDPAERKVAKTEPSDSIDQIFSAGPSSSANSPQAAASGVTAQIRNGVIDTLAGGTTETRSPTAAPDLQNRPSAPSPVLRTLDLTLSPPDLGSVRLHLSLKSNSLTIEAEASKASTAKILGDDRGSLERGLKDAGYELSSLKITDASASGATSSNNWQTNGSPSRDGDQARSSFAGRQDGDMQRREGSTPDQAQRRPKDNNQQNSSADLANGRQGNALYI
jgi:chemotaxis protein MotD